MCVFVCIYSAGAGRTGTFCALSTVLERVKAEGILDVFQTVKSLRLQRPHMVQTLVSGSYSLSWDLIRNILRTIKDINFLTYTYEVGMKPI